MRKIYLLILVFQVTILSIGQDAWLTYTTTDGLVSNSIKSLAIDTTGNLWIGTENGVSMFDGTDFTNYTTSNGLTNNSILTVFVDSKNNIWFGTMGGGVSKFDGTNWTTYTTGDGLASTIVYSIYEDINDNIWFGTTSGVSVFDGSIWTTHDNSNGLPSNIVSSICEDIQGNVWVGLWMTGVAIYDGISWTEILESDSLVYYQVTEIFRDNNDKIWVGTTDGISIFSDTATWDANYVMADGIIDDWVQGIDVDSQGNIWFATYTNYLNNGGAIMFDGINWTNYSITEGLASIDVRDVLIKEDDNIWFGTALGLTKYYSSTGINNNSNRDYNLTIYPNPSNDYFIIDCDQEIENIVISDIAGKKVYEIDNYNDRIDISNYSSGIYLITIDTDQARMQKKLIKN